ncbi:MAG: ATP phosphoribosyltransferase [Dehalococcoidia bacterium]|nr:ATP phosphoribosyltransferase [Chloroflexota bacterium]
MPLKLSLPKGWLQGSTAAFLEKAGLVYPDYHQSSRSYCPKCPGFPGLFSKVFQEKDIAIQVAIGNYDLAICGLDWIQELLVKYRSDAIVKVRDLGYGQRNLYAGTSRFSALHSVEDVKAAPDAVRIVSEYPNLAEAFALKLRLKRFRVLPVWGATDAYPPEHADLAIVSAASCEELGERDLIPIAKILTGNAWLIANRSSLEQKDMSSLLSPFYRTDPVVEAGEELSISEIDSEGEFQESRVKSQVNRLKVDRLKEGGGSLQPSAFSLRSPDSRLQTVSLALPDGHQQSHAIKLLKKAGLKINGYGSATRRPLMDFGEVNSSRESRVETPDSRLQTPDFLVKVIRPQDMPLQVASGNFDLAITGRDWLRDHLCRFPTSPVQEIADLGFGWVRIVAVVSNNLPADDTGELRNLLRFGSRESGVRSQESRRGEEDSRLQTLDSRLVLRIASEYTNIADKYARDNHLAPYKVIPTWGATEAFLPEDADVLIENTETGRTLAKHNLKIIETLFESTGCLIGNSSPSPLKESRITSLVEILKKGVNSA